MANAANFVSASSQYLSVADNASLQAGDIDLTLCAWVYFATINLTATLVGKGIANAEYRLHHPSNGAFSWAVRDTANTTTTTAAWGSNAVATTWYFVACRHDATNNLISISINAGTPVTAATSGGVRASTATFAIGALSTPANYHNGMIDEVGWWKRYLSDAEITDLYNSGSGRNYAYIAAGAPALGQGVLSAGFRSIFSGGFA